MGFEGRSKELRGEETDLLLPPYVVYITSGRSQSSVSRPGRQRADREPGKLRQELFHAALSSFVCGGSLLPSTPDIERSAAPQKVPGREEEERTEV